MKMKGHRLHGILAFIYAVAIAVHCIAAVDGTLLNVTVYVSGSLDDFLPVQTDRAWGEYGGLARVAALMRSRFALAAKDTGTNSTAIIGIFTGGFFDMYTRNQNLSRGVLLGIAESIGFRAFSLTSSDGWGGSAAFLEDYESLANASVICSNAILDSTASDRMRRLLKPYSIQTVNNVTFGILSFVDIDFCTRAFAFCGPGKDILGIDDPDSELTVTTAVNRMLSSVAVRPDVIIAVPPVSLLTSLTISNSFGDHAARSGVDIVLFSEGNYMSLAEAGSSFIPPPIVDIAVGGSGRRLLVASSLPNGKTVAKIDLTLDTAATDHRLSVRPTTTHVFLRPCAPGSTALVNPQTLCVEPAADVVNAIRPPGQAFDSVVGVLTTASLTVEGSTDCQYAECSGGNILTDAMRFYVPQCDIAFVDGASIRAGFPNGDITDRTILNAFPFENRISSFGLRGAFLADAIRHGLELATDLPTRLVAATQTCSAIPGFLQFSGLRIRYNPFDRNVLRLLSVEREVTPGAYDLLDNFAVYRCCAPSFLVDGGKGYSVITDNALHRVDYDVTVVNVVQQYLAANPDGLNLTLGQRIIVDARPVCVPACVHGSCTISLTCVCDVGWTGADCNTTASIDTGLYTCDLHRTNGKILLRTRGAIDNFPVGVGVITLFLVLFVAEVLCVPYFTHRFARVLQTSRSRSNDIVRTARLNRANVIRLVLLALQGVQIHAIVLNVELSDIFVESNGKVFSSISITSFASSFFWYFWVVMAVTLLWLVYAWAYVLDGGMFLRKTAAGRVFLIPADQFLQLWVSAGFIPTLLNSMRAFHCWYLDDATAFMATDGVCSVRCWAGEHWAYVTVALITLLVYYPLATISALLWQDLDAHQEVRNAPHAFIVEPLIKVALVVMRVYFTSFPVAYLSIVAVICAATAVYHWRWAPCYVAWVNTPIALAYISAFGTALVLLIGVVADRSDAFFAVPAIWVAAAVAVLVYLRWMYPDDLVKRKPHEADLNAREMLMAIKKVFVRRGSAAVSTPSFPQTSGAQLRARLSVAWNNPVTSVDSEVTSVCNDLPIVGNMRSNASSQRKWSGHALWTPSAVSFADAAAQSRKTVDEAVTAGTLDRAVGRWFASLDPHLHWPASIFIASISDDDFLGMVTEIYSRITTVSQCPKCAEPMPSLHCVGLSSCTSTDDGAKTHEDRSNCGGGDCADDIISVQSIRCQIVL